MKKPISNVKLHMLYIETGLQKVAEVLFKFPEKEFNLSDLAKEAGVAKANIGKILDDLNKMGFLEIIKLTKIWRIKAKQDSWNFTKSKIIRNLNFLYWSNVVEILNEHYRNPKSIILFGSFRRGDDISTSDIDIAIESEETKDYRVVELRELKEIENKLGKKIQIHIFNRRNVDINVFNNIANGIILSGFLEVKP